MRVITENDYYIVQFMDLPYDNIEKYVIVPHSWITLWELNTGIVDVAYPEEDPIKTSIRVARNEQIETNWPIFKATILHDSDTYYDAYTWIIQQKEKGHYNFKRRNTENNNSNKYADANIKKYVTIEDKGILDTLNAEINYPNSSPSQYYKSSTNLFPHREDQKCNKRKTIHITGRNKNPHPLSNKHFTPVETYPVLASLLSVRDDKRPFSIVNKHHTDKTSEENEKSDQKSIKDVVDQSAYIRDASKNQSTKTLTSTNSVYQPQFHSQSLQDKIQLSRELGTLNVAGLKKSTGSVRDDCTDLRITSQTFNNLKSARQCLADLPNQQHRRTEQIERPEESFRHAFNYELPELPLNSNRKVIANRTELNPLTAMSKSTNLDNLLNINKQHIDRISGRNEKSGENSIEVINERAYIRDASNIQLFTTLRPTKAVYQPQLHAQSLQDKIEFSRELGTLHFPDLEQSIGSVTVDCTDQRTTLRSFNNLKSARQCLSELPNKKVPITELIEKPKESFRHAFNYELPLNSHRKVITSGTELNPLTVMSKFTNQGNRMHLQSDILCHCSQLPFFANSSKEVQYSKQNNSKESVRIEFTDPREITQTRNNLKTFRQNLSNVSNQTDKKRKRTEQVIEPSINHKIIVNNNEQNISTTISDDSNPGNCRHLKPGPDNTHSYHLFTGESFLESHDSAEPQFQEVTKTSPPFEQSLSNLISQSSNLKSMTGNFTPDIAKNRYEGSLYLTNSSNLADRYKTFVNLGTIIKASVTKNLVKAANQQSQYNMKFNNLRSTKKLTQVNKPKQVHCPYNNLQNIPNVVHNSSNRFYSEKHLTEGHLTQEFDDKLPQIVETITSNNNNGNKKNCKDNSYLTARTNDDSNLTVNKDHLREILQMTDRILGTLSESLNPVNHFYMENESLGDQNSPNQLQSRQIMAMPVSGDMTDHNMLISPTCVSRGQQRLLHNQDISNYASFAAQKMPASSDVLNESAENVKYQLANTIRISQDSSIQKATDRIFRVHSPNHRCQTKDNSKQQKCHTCNMSIIDNKLSKSGNLEILKRDGDINIITEMLLPTRKTHLAADTNCKDKQLTTAKEERTSSVVREPMAPSKIAKFHTKLKLLEKKKKDSIKVSLKRTPELDRVIESMKKKAKDANSLDTTDDTLNSLIKLSTNRVSQFSQSPENVCHIRQEASIEEKMAILFGEYNYAHQSLSQIQIEPAKTEFNNCTNNLVAKVNETFDKSNSSKSKQSGKKRRWEKLYETSKQKCKSKVSVNLPPEYDPNNTRWTLKYKRRGPGIVELLPHSGVYVELRKLLQCKHKAKNCKTLARNLLTEIFTKNALKVCSFTETGYESKGKGPTLDEVAKTTLLMYVHEYGIRNNWCDTHSYLKSIQNKIYNIKRKQRRIA